MAAKEKISSFRHEGHVFFIYDHRAKTEEDDPKDAILYFYPRSFEVDDQVALVGGIVGIADFCLEFVPECMPNLLKVAGHNFALLQQEDFVIALAGNPDIPDKFLLSHMQFVWSTFVLYQGSLGAIRERVPAANFVRELNLIWDMYLPLCQIQGDDLSQAFQALPYVQLHKTQASLFLHASHILQRSMRHNGVIAGALFNKNKVLCSQLSNSLTRQLLLLMSHSQFPCVEAGSALELPGGVRLLYVFVPLEESATLGNRRRKAYTHQTSSAGEGRIEKPQPRSRHSPATQEHLSRRGGMEKGHSNATDGNKAALSERENTMSPSMGLTSGTDSEVFMDTLSEINIDPKQELKLSEIKEVECAASSKKLDSSSNEVEVKASSVMIKNKTDTDGASEVVSQAEENLLKTNTEIISTSKNLADGLPNLQNLQSKVPSRNDSQMSQSKKESPDDNHLNSVIDEKPQESAAVENVSNEDCDEVVVFSDLNKNNSNESSVASNLNLSKETDSKDLEANKSEIGEVVTELEQPEMQNEVTASTVLDNINEVESQSNIPNKTLSNVGMSAEPPDLGTNPDLDHEKISQINVDTNIEEKNSSLQEISVSSSNETNVSAEDQNKEEIQTRREGHLKTENKSNSTSLSPEPAKLCSEKEKERYIKETLAQSQREIDASLDTGLTDDESSNSSSGVKLEDQDGSLLSLACAEISSTKDRLTFESVDSENSEGGIISPISEAGRLSPVAEASSLLNKNLSGSHSDTDEETKLTNKTRESEGGVDNVLVTNTQSVNKESEAQNNSESAAKFDPERNGLEEMILYAQGHSDTLLVLLMSRDTKCSRTYINSLWKSCLSHLAELDFEVKNAERHVKDDSEVLGSTYQYMRYDTFTQGLKGSAFQPVTSLANEIVDSSVKMHGDFIDFPDLQDSTYRSHSACSIGHRTPDSETYFQLGVPQINGGISSPMDLTFSLQEVAEKVLQDESKISVL